MKKLLAVLFIFVICGCENNYLEEKEIPSKIIVEITRSINWNIDTHLYIAADNAYLKNDMVVIEGLVSITSGRPFLGNGYKWVVPKIEIKDNKLIIPIPRDTRYSVVITTR